MRIELDKPLTKTKLRQALKMMNDGKFIKVIMGAEIFNINRIVAENDTIYLCTDSKETCDFYEKRVIQKEEEKDCSDSILEKINLDKTHYYTTSNDDLCTKKCFRDEPYLDKEIHIGDYPPFGDDIT